MDDERLRRARAEAEAERLRTEVQLLSEERLRLCRRNERLSAALCVLRDRERDETVQALIEDALGFDGLEPEFFAGDEDPSFALAEANGDDD